MHSETTISVSHVFRGRDKLNLRSSLVEMRWHKEYNEPCMVLDLAEGREYIVGPSSVDYIMLASNAICVKLLQAPSMRITKFAGNVWNSNINSFDQCLVLKLVPFEDSKYVRIKCGDQVDYLSIESLHTIFEFSWAPYHEYQKDALRYMIRAADFPSHPFAESVSSRTFEVILDGLQSSNNPNPISQQINKLSINNPLVTEEATVLDQSAEIISLDTPVSNGFNRKPLFSKENGKMNGQHLTYVAEPHEEEVLVKYPRGKDGVDVLLRDMCRLPYTEMLNDTNIELGVKYIMEKNKEFSQSCFPFSTYFFGKLTENIQSCNYRNPEHRRQLVKANYQRLKRWTRKVDLFERDHLVVPVNTDLHWCIMIIKNPKAMLEKDGQEPCLYIMLDSIPDSDEIRGLGFEIIQDYLELEFEEKKKKTNPNLVFNRENMKKVMHKYNPVQKNFVDCGIYLLAFFEQYAKKLPHFTENYELDWLEYSPFFEIVTVKYYREKLINFIKLQAGKTRWSRLEQFERNRAGVTNPSLDSRVEAKRKTRAHSFCMADWQQYEKEMSNRRNTEKRAHSLPPRLNKLLSTRPIVISRLNGIATCPI